MKNKLKIIIFVLIILIIGFVYMGLSCQGLFEERFTLAYDDAGNMFEFFSCELKLYPKFSF